jgi:hypothetical protein
LPSPNIPSWQSALFFPSFVVLESQTSISEGRGSTLPFQLVGMPGLDAERFIGEMQQEQQQQLKCGGGPPEHSSVSGTTGESVRPILNVGIFVGIAAAPHRFRPTFNKNQGQVCNGVFFHYQLPNSAAEPNLFALGIRFLLYCVQHSAALQWRSPSVGYEYNFTDPPVLLILGSERWRELLPLSAAGAIPSHQPTAEKMDELLQWSHKEAMAWAAEHKDVHLYAN